LAVFLTALTRLVAVYSADLSVRAFLDKNVVGIGEQFTVSIEFSGADAETVSQPDAPDIEAFGRFLGSGSSRNIQIVNGQMSSTRTINYYFQAISPGKFEIGSIPINHQGEEYRTDPIQLEIVERHSGRSGTARGTPQGRVSDRDLFVRATVSKTRVYENEGVLVTYKIYTRVNVSGYSLSQVPDKTGFWVEDLLKDQQRPPTSTEIVDGLQYTVATVQRMVLFPTSPGEKTLEPLEIECELQARPERRSLFDDFFSDPFGRTFRYSVRSDPIRIEILPLPDSGRPKGFSGAVGQFTLSGGVDKTKLSANEVATFTVKITGSGNIRTLPSPEVSFSTGLENYEPTVAENVQVTDGVIHGSRAYEYVLVPRTPGHHRIDPVQFPYFDPVTEEYKIASLPETNLEVAPGGQPVVDVPGKSLAKEDVRLLAQEIRFIKLDPGYLREIDYAISKRPLFWGIALLPVFGVLVGYWYRRHLDRLRDDQSYARSRQARRLARKRLAAAKAVISTLDRQHFYSQCGKALQGFAGDKLNIPEAGIISEKLAQILRAREVSASAVDEYLACMKICDEKRFSPVESGPEEMTEFLKRTERAMETLHKELST